MGVKQVGIKATIGAADITAAAIVPPTVEFPFLKTGTYNARILPATRPLRPALLPSASSMYSPAARHNYLYPYVLAHPRHGMCSNVYGAISGGSLSDGAAQSSAAAVVRLAQPRMNFFGFYDNPTKNHGGRDSGICGKNAELQCRRKSVPHQLVRCQSVLSLDLYRDTHWGIRPLLSKFFVGSTKGRNTRAPQKPLARASIGGLFQKGLLNKFLVSGV